MARIILAPFHPIYHEYELGPTEKKIEELIESLGFEIGTRILRNNEAGLPEAKEYSRGYDLGWADGESRYIETGMDHGRYVCVHQAASLDETLKMLADDVYVYQYLGFAIEHPDSCYDQTIKLERYRLGPTDVTLSVGRLPAQILKRQLIEKYPDSYYIEPKSSSAHEEEIQFDVPYIELCETVVDAIKAMKDP